MVEKDYDLGKVLGEGNYAQVKIAIEKSTKLKWACKIIDKNKLEEGDEEMLELEVEVLQILKHPNVVRLKDKYDTRKKLYLILELVTGGELLEKLMSDGAYSEQDACDLFAKVMGAVKYLHDNGIAHRDLKPENLLLSDKTDKNSIKIADFGFAKIISKLEARTDGKKLMETSCGTPEYVAPEVLQNIGYGTSCDIWSMGVILYIMLCGFPPFYDENMTKLFKQVMHKMHDFPSPEWDPVSADAKDLINRMLEKDPVTRITAAQILEHKWVADHNSAEELTHAHTNLKKFNTRRKFRRGVDAARAIRRMHGAMAGGAAAS